MKIQKETNLLTQRALAVDEALDERANASAAADSDFLEHRRKRKHASRFGKASLRTKAP